MKKAGVLYGTVILIATNLVIRLLSFSYDVLLSKLIGAEGTGLFQMTMPVLMIFLAITSTGIPTAVSRLTAEQISRNNNDAVGKILNISIIFTLVLSAVLVFALILSGKYISARLLANDDTLSCIYLLAPAIVIISLTSVIRGYYYGLKRMGTAGISEIIEHVTRFVLVLGFLAALSPIKPAAGALIAVIGISVGELFDLIWLVSGKNCRSARAHCPIKTRIAGISFLPKILHIAIPLTLSGLFGIILQFLNAVLIPRKLMEAGYTSSEAVASFGRASGMAMPLIYLPFIVTSALVVNIIPCLSEQVSEKNFKKARSDMALAIKITLLVSVPLTVLYALYSSQIGVFLYSDSQVGGFIKIMGLSTVFLTLQHTLSGMLYALGRQIQAVVHRFAGMVLQLSAVYFLAGNPNFGINGYFIGFTLCTAVVCLLDWIAVNRRVKFRIRYGDMFLKPLAAAAFMVALDYSLQAFNFHPNSGDPVSFLFRLFISGIAYVLALDVLKAIPRNLAGRIFALYK